MTRVVGFGVSWGQVPITATRFSFTRSIGLEPDATEMVFSESQFVEFVTKLDPLRFEPQQDEPTSGLVDDLNTLIPKEPVSAPERLPYVADLHIAWQLQGDAEERFHSVLAKQAEAGAEDLIESLLADIQDFTHGIPQHDDITVVALRRLPEAASMPTPVRQRQTG